LEMEWRNRTPKRRWDGREVRESIRAELFARRKSSWPGKISKIADLRRPKLSYRPNLAMSKMADKIVLPIIANTVKYLMTLSRASRSERYSISLSITALLQVEYSILIRPKMRDSE
jgi:hypothetical protein